MTENCNDTFQNNTSPPCAYGLFVASIRAKYESNNLPELKLPETNNRWTIFIKYCMNLWNNMSEDDKRHYEKLVDQVKKLPKLESQKRPLQTDQYKKRASSAFYHYCKDHSNEIQQEHPEYKISDIAVELGTRWQAASLETKEKYEHIAQEDYRKNMEAD